MFSILVSELTPELLAKAEYWRLFAQMADNRMWADTRHRDSLCVVPVVEESPYPLIDRHSDFNAYAGHVRCFPVSLAPEGTETRLEMPRMPDEPLIEEWQGFNGIPNKPAREMLTPVPSVWWCLLLGHRQYREANAPTPNHYPRRTLEGMWVWSTRQ